MARKVFNMDEEQPNNILSEYIAKKQQLDQLTKEVKQLNEAVKAYMASNQLNRITENGFNITKSESKRISWKSDLLLEKVRTYDLPELIETVEQVNMPALEQAILDEKVNVEDLMDCQQTTEVTTLRITKVKENQDEL